jgi:hypothetical protein
MQNPKLSPQRILLIVLAALVVGLLLKPAKIQAQRNPAIPVAQVGAGSPLPVYVVNDQPPVLPDGFVAGSSWKFTTWTIPSTLSFTATVQKTEGGWALLALNGAEARPNWYYIPHMPGAWEQQ